MMEYEIVIGLEVHVHLKTSTKAFCGCSTEFGQEPNSQTCPVCLGMPGSLPVLNKLALEYALEVALALNCSIQEFTKFDRKNYFYPDLPKNYQISQYDLPLAKEGFLDVQTPDTDTRIEILRVHLEEDAGKLIHKDQISLVDFNRAGIPLLEIVSKPQINSPEEAHAYLVTLKSIIGYLGVSDCDMEKGSLRCDANISLRQKGAKGLGVKTEIKNLNSFKAVKDALSFEVARQEGLLQEGSAIIQETRLWDTREEKTVSMRSKEEAKDYRYFPEPDLPPFVIKKDMIEAIRQRIPELPREKCSRFMKQYGLSQYDAQILTVSRETAEYAQECLRQQGVDKKIISNWLIGPVSAAANSRNCGIEDLGLLPASLIELVRAVETQQISNLTGKAVLEEMLLTSKSAGQIIKEKNLAQISDIESLTAEIEAVIQDNRKSVNDFISGKENALMFLVGQVMKRTKGKANPKVVQDALRRRLTDA